MPAVLGPVELSKTFGPTSIGRTIRAVSVGTFPGQMVTVSFELDSQGDEASASFTVNFDPTKLSNPVVALGTGVPAGSDLGTNVNQTSAGRIGILVDSTNVYAAGTRHIITITFNATKNASVDSTTVSFGSTLVPESVSNANGILLTTTYETGNVSIGSTACDVTVSGLIRAKLRL